MQPRRIAFAVALALSSASISPANAASDDHDVLARHLFVMSSSGHLEVTDLATVQKCKDAYLHRVETTNGDTPTPIDMSAPAARHAAAVGIEVCIHASGLEGVHVYDSLAPLGSPYLH